MRTAIIYMAAGNSRRFGSNKLLYEIDGRPMYRHVLDRLLLLSAEGETAREVFLVTQYEEICRMHAESPELAETAAVQKPDGQTCQDVDGRQKLHIVYSPDSRLGVSYTIRAGIRAAKQCGPFDFFAFFTADQPYLTEKTVERFLETIEREHPPLASLRFAGKPGSPTCFSRVYLPELLALTGDHGGRRILKQHSELVCCVEADSEEELQDFDRPESFFASV